MLGPQLGLDPIYGAYPVFRPDYATFYSPISPADFASFTGFLNNESRTWNNMARAQITNTALFSLPGGDAGLAFAVEGGNEGWDYSPDSRMIEDPDTLESQVWGQTSVSGSGHRSRYALTGELRMPLLNPLTVTLSGRYDALDIAGQTVDSPTYSIGLEYRPVQSLLFRGKYGTAFRAPTLADTFQGMSGFYTRAPDFYRCSLEGYDPADVEGCSWENAQFFGQQSGNTELEPIDADVWSAGVVFAPSSSFSLAVDYYNWDITNEVDQLSPRQLLLTEHYCRTGQTGNLTTSCENALEWVRRSANGELVSVYTPKVNIAQQKLETVTASLNYMLDVGAAGSLAFAANYTNKLSHDLIEQPGDPAVDLLRDPYYMWIYDSYAKTRMDASVAWSLGDWTTTLYANRLGSTPNYLAYVGESWDYEHSSGERAGKWGSYTTYNMSVNWRAMDNLTFSAMVNNVFNKMPDNQARNFPGTESTPYNNYFYDVYGRAVYLEAKYQFN